jgi:hypothetical protein
MADQPIDGDTVFQLASNPGRSSGSSGGPGDGLTADLAAPIPKVFAFLTGREFQRRLKNLFSIHRRH